MRSASDPVVEVDGLRKQYGELTAVDGASFEIHADEIFALVGPNGAGKTTLVEILECLRTPSGGSARVLGHDVETEPRAIKAEIGVVPQSFHTFDRLSVRENVALTRRMYDDGRDVDEVLTDLDLESYADTRFEELSGGYQRRTGIAMALVSDPSVLFLDEPTTGLDPSARRGTWRQIERLAEQGTTVVLTTHYMDEVEELADRAALLVDGAVEAVDTVPNLIETYGGDVKLVVGTGGRSERDEVEDSDAGGDDAGGDDAGGDVDGGDVAGEGDADGDTTGGEDAAVEAILRADAVEVYRNETDDLVAIYEDRAIAQRAFGELLDVDGERSIDLTTAGMEDVFLRLAGRTVGSGGDLR